MAPIARVTETPKWARRTLTVAVAVLLVSGVSSAYIRQGSEAVSVDDAVRQYRDAAAAPESPEATVEDGGTVADTPAPASTVPGAAPPPAAGAPAGRAAGPATPGGSGSGNAPSPPAPTAPGAAQPAASAAIEEGVYVYATRGYEETNALGGARHDYPQETVVTLRSNPCGWVQRWQPLAERWDESELCREGEAVAIRRFTTYHEFFQRGQRQEFTCPAGSHVARPASPGEQWRWECTWESSRITTLVTFIGTEPFAIDGKSIQADRFLYESQLTGANRGTQRQERWLHADSGLNLRIATDVDIDADSPFGAVRYEEHYTINLTSLRPRR